MCLEPDDPSSRLFIITPSLVAYQNHNHLVAVLWPDVILSSTTHHTSLEHVPDNEKSSEYVLHDQGYISAVVRACVEVDQDACST